MTYNYFGNTSLRVKNLLYNFETQLILFEELFKNADKQDTWSNDSELQLKYLELLEQHNLLESKNKTSHLGTKDARVKSAPLQDYGLINRKNKKITSQGYELLELIKTQSYKIYNDFLQIDLISLFFLKATLKFDIFYKYLEVFKAFDGNLGLDYFRFLPLVNNFKTTKDFIDSIKNKTLIPNLFANSAKYTHNLELFLTDLQNNTLKTHYFKTAKGEKTALSIIKVLQEVFVPFIKTQDKAILQDFIDSKNFLDFKKLYLSYITKSTKKDEKILALKNFCTRDLLEFGKKFFEFIFTARILANLNDYMDLNKRYLNLTGIFDFQNDKVSLNILFALILKHSKSNEILKELSQNPVSSKLLKEYFDDKEFKTSLKKLGISNLNDIKNYKRNLDKEKLKNLLRTRFKKEDIIEILELFNDRKNDTKIFEKITTDAKIPTIFEYIIAIAWCYIDDGCVDRILDAGLSLDSNLLPKSHALGGNADFVYSYETHSLMIEATLNEKTNQRRAEMESVSRHLGNLLLCLDARKQAQSYGIFIAPYLDKNVLNDFRSRLNCYFENEKAYVKGMKILPLSTQDLITILKSNLNYKTLLPKFQQVLKDKQMWGRKWYETQIKALINGL